MVGDIMPLEQVTSSFPEHSDLR